MKGPRRKFLGETSILYRIIVIITVDGVYSHSVHSI